MKNLRYISTIQFGVIIKITGKTNKNPVDVRLLEKHGNFDTNKLSGKNHTMFSCSPSFKFLRTSIILTAAELLAERLFIPEMWE